MLLLKIFFVVGSWSLNSIKDFHFVTWRGDKEGNIMESDIWFLARTGHVIIMHSWQRQLFSNTYPANKDQANFHLPSLLDRAEHKLTLIIHHWPCIPVSSSSSWDEGCCRGMSGSARSFSEPCGRMTRRGGGWGRTQSSDQSPARPWTFD